MRFKVSAPSLMRDVRRRTTIMRWLSISALTLLLVGCQCFTRVTVSGSLAQGIVFQAPVGSDLAVGKAELEDLMVVAVGAGESQPVWHIKGKGRIDALKY